MPRNQKSKPGKKRSDSSARAFFLFLAGCGAEIYIFILRRYYYSGPLRQMLAWADYLPVLGVIGLAICAASLIALIISRKRKSDGKLLSTPDNASAGIRKTTLWTSALLFLCIESGFLAAASFLTRWNMSAIFLFSALVPTATALGILWLLYDRECALSLTILSAAAFIAWLRYRGTGYAFWIQIIAAFCIFILAAVAFLVSSGKLSKLLSAELHAPLIYISCALSASGLICALIGPSAAYSALIGLAMVIFGLVVYDTVKQL